MPERLWLLHFTRRELLANSDRNIDWHICGSGFVVPKAAHLPEASWHGLGRRCMAHSLAAALCLEPQACRRESIGNWDQNAVPKSGPENGSEKRHRHGSNHCGWNHKRVEKVDRFSALKKGPEISAIGVHTKIANEYNCFENLWFHTGKRTWNGAENHPMLESEGRQTACTYFIMRDFIISSGQ